MRHARWLAIIGLSLLATTVSGQPTAPDEAARAQALAPLKSFVGQWQGEGWIAYPPGERSPIRTAVTAAFHGGGAFFVLEEQAWGRLGGADAPETPLHTAMTVYHYDPHTRSLGVRMYEVSVGAVDGVVLATTDMVTLVFVAPGGGGRFRLTMMSAADTWAMFGHESADGSVWTQNLEVRYRRAEEAEDTPSPQPDSPGE